MKNSIFHSFLAVLIWLPSQFANAHSLPMDNGTLNVSEGRAYVVLNLPVHAFRGIDDNKDGRLSSAEFEKHSQQMRQDIVSGFAFANSYANSDDASDDVKNEIGSAAKKTSMQNLVIFSMKPAIEQSRSSHSHEPISEAARKALQATHVTVLATVRFPEKYWAASGIQSIFPSNRNQLSVHAVRQTCTAS